MKHVLVMLLAVLALGACQLVGSPRVEAPAVVKLRPLAADDVATAFDPLELGLPDIHAVAALPDGGALLATEGGLWRYQADGEAKQLSTFTYNQSRFAASGISLA